MIVILAALLGGFFNRVRGGLFGLSGGDWIFGGAYAVFVFFLGCSLSQSLLTGLLIALAMMPGWGSYIGAMGGIKWNWLDGGQHEWPPIDFIIRWASDRPRLWGALGLLGRGALIGAAAAFAAGIFGFLAGLLMPVAYFVGISGEQLLLKRNGFEWGEIVFGAILWALTAAGIN